MDCVNHAFLFLKLVELSVVEVCDKFHACLRRLKFDQDCVFLVIRPLSNTQMLQVCFVEHGTELAALF